MTSIPLPTFVPQDAWYSLTKGNLNPNIADSVPTAADLLPAYDSTNTLQDGIVGSLDQAVIYLAGTSTPLDGGQAWLMWEASSLATSDGINVFCPFVDASTPGRWVNTSVFGGIGVTVRAFTFLGGTTHTISPQTTPFIVIFVRGGTNDPTEINLPVTTFMPQQIRIKDANGNAATYPITIFGSIDGATSDTISTDYAERTYIWNGSEWSAG